MKEIKTATPDGTAWYALFEVWQTKLALPMTQRSYNRFRREEGPTYLAMMREAGHNRALRKTITEAQQSDRNTERGIYTPQE